MIYQTVVAANAWITSPLKHGGYTNLEMLIFYSVFSFGLAFLAALAVPAVPIIAGAFSTGYGAYIFICPQKMLLMFAPRGSEQEEVQLKKSNSFLTNTCHIEEEKLEELLELAKKGELTDDYLIENVPVLKEKIADIKQQHEAVGLEEDDQ